MPNYPVIRASRRKLVELLRDDPEWFQNLLDEISHGKGIATACLERVISHVAVLEWVYDVAHPERLEAYYRALRVAAESMVHECAEIADSGEDVGRDKLRIDTRFKIAGKWDRERYGDERGAGSSNGVTVVINQFANQPVEVPEGRTLDAVRIPS